MRTFFIFISFFLFCFPGASFSEESNRKKERTKKFLIQAPNETSGEIKVIDPPKKVSTAPKVKVEVKSPKTEQAQPEADAPAEIKSEVKQPAPADDDDF